MSYRSPSGCRCAPTWWQPSQILRKHFWPSNVSLSQPDAAVELGSPLSSAVSPIAGVVVLIGNFAPIPPALSMLTWVTPLEAFWSSCCQHPTVMNVPSNKASGARYIVIVLFSIS